MRPRYEIPASAMEQIDKRIREHIFFNQPTAPVTIEARVKTKKHDVESLVYVTIKPSAAVRGGYDVDLDVIPPQELHK